MNILVDIKGHQHFYTVDGPQVPLAALAQQIHAATCIAPEFLQLSLHGAALDFSKSFAEYGIGDESLLYGCALPGACDEWLLAVRNGNVDGDGDDSGICSLQGAVAAIRAVHAESAGVHAAISAVQSVRQYSYRASYTCVEGMPSIEVRETVVESDVGQVLAALSRTQTQTQTAASSAGAGAGAGAAIYGSGDGNQKLQAVRHQVCAVLEPVEDVLNHHMSLAVESWLDLQRVSQACVESAADYLQQAEYLNEPAAGPPARVHRYVSSSAACAVGGAAREESSA